VITEHDLLKLANVRPNWDAFLDKLSRVAAPERWSKPGTAPGEKLFLVLSNLVRHTIRRAVHVEAVAFGEYEVTETFAFCPRLRTLTFESLYLIAFRTPPEQGDREWRLDQICRAPETRRFLGLAPRAALPGAPRFWDDPAELVLEPEALETLDVDVEHLASNDRLVPLFPADLQRDLTIRASVLDRAINIAVERGCENPRIAAPVFQFESAESGSGHVRLCLPLYLSQVTEQDRSADLALVIEPKLANDLVVGYEPKTLLSTGDVYLQSRIFEVPSQEVWPRP